MTTSTGSLRQVDDSIQVQRFHVERMRLRDQGCPFPGRDVEACRCSCDAGASHSQSLSRDSREDSSISTKLASPPEKMQCFSSPRMTDAFELSLSEKALRTSTISRR